MAETSLSTALRTNLTTTRKKWAQLVDPRRPTGTPVYLHRKGSLVTLNQWPPKFPKCHLISSWPWPLTAKSKQFLFVPDCTWSFYGRAPASGTEVSLLRDRARGTLCRLRYDRWPATDSLGDIWLKAHLFRTWQSRRIVTFDFHETSSAASSIILYCRSTMWAICNFTMHKLDVI